MLSFIILSIFCETMKHQAAYSLLLLSGNKNPTQANVEDFMKASGISVDKESLTLFFTKLEGTNVQDAIAAGSKKLVSMPSGGARVAAAGGAASAAVAEAPKEEKKEEVEDVDMGGLFGGDDDY